MKNEDGELLNRGTFKGLILTLVYCEFQLKIVDFLGDVISKIFRSHSRSSSLLSNPTSNPLGEMFVFVMTTFDLVFYVNGFLI